MIIFNEKEYQGKYALYDNMLLVINSNLTLNEIYEKLGSIDDYFGFKSFKKREWTLILNDLIQLYPNIDFI